MRTRGVNGVSPGPSQTPRDKSANVRGQKTDVLAQAERADRRETRRSAPEDRHRVPEPSGNCSPSSGTPDRGRSPPSAQMRLQTEPEPFVSPRLRGSARRLCPSRPSQSAARRDPALWPEPGPQRVAAMTPADASLPQKQSTEEMESTVELLPVEFQELVTVKDEEMDFAHVEVDQLNSAQRNMGLDLKVESCGSLVFWGKEVIL
nr:uncharacterized protein LOC123276709 [Equus asinus]